MNILNTIVEHKRQEVAVRRNEVPLSALELQPMFDRKTRSLREHISNAPDGFGIIAEFKRRSPSAGIIRDDIDPVDAAVRYEQSGAAGVSVLTDEHYFGGSLDDMRRVREAVAIPVLRKDFIIDEYQLFEAKAFGADAVLLIADILTEDLLAMLFETASDLDLECLIEVYDRASLTKIDFKRMRLIGINNRDLRTFEVNIHHTADIIAELPGTVTIISESGVTSPHDIQTIKRFGAHGALIGEWFMKNGSQFNFEI